MPRQLTVKGQSRLADHGLGAQNEARHFHSLFPDFELFLLPEVRHFPQLDLPAFFRGGVRAYEREIMEALGWGEGKERSGVSDGERRRRESEGCGAYAEGAKAETVPVDVEAQQRELEAAGWERLERMGKLVWRRPNSNYLVPTGRGYSSDKSGQASRCF